MKTYTLPDTYNVYGYISCGDKIAVVKDLFLRTYGLSSESVILLQGVLKVESISMEAEINRKDSKRWSLNAAIPGDPNQVTDVINQIAQQLYWNGIGSVFEVYNDSFECVDNILFNIQE
jgi:hypothetical protein